MDRRKSFNRLVFWPLFLTACFIAGYVHFQSLANEPFGQSPFGALCQGSSDVATCAEAELQPYSQEQQQEQHWSNAFIVLTVIGVLISISTVVTYVDELKAEHRRKRSHES